MKRPSIAAVVQRVFTEETGSFAPSEDLVAIYSSVVTDVMDARRRRAHRPTVLGICGPQGAGKSTMTRILEATLSENAGLSVAVLSLDDLYLTGAERASLARDIHPLLRTRGVPGTHDVALGIDVIKRLTGARSGEQILLPRFDKAVDEPCPEAGRKAFHGRADIVIFEGWCVGAIPERADALVDPINSLERTSDPDACWRKYVNGQLADRYQSLFSLVDVLVMLRAPGFDPVFGWRRAQERKLASGFRPGQGAPAASMLMSDDELLRFVMHYERLTRHIQAEMPSRAHIIVELDADRQMTAVSRLADSPWQPDSR